MNIVELALVYVVAGVVSTVVVARRCGERGWQRWLNLGLSLLLWPLWLPVTLTRTEDLTQPAEAPATVGEQALYQGYAAIKGTPLEKLLPRESVDRIALELRRVVERDRELSQVLSQPSFHLEAAHLRVRELAQGLAPPRAVIMAERHLENIERLAALQARDRQLLAELGDWLTTLRTQLVLARYSSTSADGVSDIFAEVCARVEVLGSTLDEPSLAPPAPAPSAWPNTYS